MEIIIAELVLWLESVPRAQGGGAQRSVISLGEKKKKKKKLELSGS